MRSHAVKSGFPERLLECLGETHRVMAPVVGKDGVCRLQDVSCWGEIAPCIPLIPAKKVLLPPQDPLWTLGEQDYRLPEPPTRPAAIIGIFPCDLYGLDYLDRVFAEDVRYGQRRENLVRVGVPCDAEPECFCPPRRQPPPFDLFLDGERVWAGSPQGEALLATLAEALDAPAETPLPKVLTRGRGEVIPADLDQIFLRQADHPLWRQIGERCVSCGACSAVCPTCYCYDMVDEALPGAATRLRQWDNCFFPSHALVAGGHNFRPGRAERLRFRFEHKLLGFGLLRGICSCVGCGRCARACPVDIDMAEVLALLTPGEEI